MRIVETCALISLAYQFCRPGSVWQSTFHPVRNIQASQKQIRTALQRLPNALFDTLFRLLAAWLAFSAGIPQTRKVGLAVGGTRRWSLSVELSVLSPRNTIGTKCDPLCVQTARQNQKEAGQAHSRQYTMAANTAAIRRCSMSSLLEPPEVQLAGPLVQEHVRRKHT